MVMDVRFNGRMRTEDRWRVFVCRLTDGRYAVVPEALDAEVLFYPNLAEVKQHVALLVLDIRIPLYQDYELAEVRRVLSEKGEASANASSHT